MPILVSLMCHAWKRTETSNSCSWFILFNRSERRGNVVERSRSVVQFS